MKALIKTLAIVVVLVANTPVLACEVCKKQQPKVLRGITHGAGPQSGWDYVVVWCMVIIAAVSLFYSIKWILRPGEGDSKHIKRSILNLE
jgi:hypothetical protein